MLAETVKTKVIEPVSDSLLPYGTLVVHLPKEDCYAAAAEKPAANVAKIFAFDLELSLSLP